MSLALDAVKTVHIEDGGRKEIDIKRYAKVEKIPGGDVEDSRVLKGVMLNKDVTHGKMRRKIHSAPHASPLTPPLPPQTHTPAPQYYTPLDLVRFSMPQPTHSPNGHMIMYNFFANMVVWCM